MRTFSFNRIDVPQDLSDRLSIAAHEADPESTGLQRRQVEAIWQAVEQLYRSGVFPALTFCLRHRGAILLERGLGHARGHGPEDHDPRQAVTVRHDDPICLFSASKAITAMLVHWLNQEGLIDLTDPVSRYIPEFASHGKKNATIYHLLTHKGGIPRLEGDFDPELLYDHEAIVKILCAAHPVSSGGRRLAYHALTAGFILGELIQRVTGKDARHLLNRVIRQPMAMKYFDYGLPADMRERMILNYATGLRDIFPLNRYLQHVLGGSLEMAVQMCNDPRFQDALIPAGNIYASAEEACRFFEMLRQRGRYGDRQIFEPATVHRAVLEANAPELDGSLLLPMRYSMGFMLGSRPLGLFGPQTGQAFGHLGFTSIFCWADPARESSVALMTSGKALLGPHVQPLAKLLYTLSSRLPTSGGAK